MNDNKKINIQSLVEKIRSQEHHWFRYVRNFRKDHSLGISFGLIQSDWQFDRFGNLKNEHVKSHGVETSIKYTYHFQFYKTVGYFLGSGFGYQISNTVSGLPVIPNVINFPGVLAGGVINLLPSVRLVSGIDFHLERYEKLKSNDDPLPDRKEISITMECKSVFTQLDLFYQLNWAITLGYEYRDTRYFKPKESLGFDVDASFNSESSLINLGVLYHLI